MSKRMNKDGLTINEPVKKLFNFMGFTAQIGSITGKIKLGNTVYYYVYTGRKKREKRPDNTSAGWMIQLWLCEKHTANTSGLYSDSDVTPYWEKRWISCSGSGDGLLARRIMNTNPQIKWTPKYKEEGARNLLAYVPKQKDLGFIYTMVRERQ